MVFLARRCFWNEIARAVNPSRLPDTIPDQWIFSQIFGQIWSTTANFISKLRKNIFQLIWKIIQKYYSFKLDLLWHSVCISKYQETARYLDGYFPDLLDHPACQNIWQNTNSDQINRVLLDIQTKPNWNINLVKPFHCQCRHTSTFKKKP